MADEAQSGSQQPQTTPDTKNTDTKNTDTTKPNTDSNNKSDGSAEMFCYIKFVTQRVKGVTDKMFEGQP